MPKRQPGSGWTPKARPHKGKDGRVRARVRISGKDYYLGAWGTPEADKAYRELISNWLAGSTNPKEPPADQRTVTHLLDAWSRHADREYRQPNGRPTSELYFCKILAPLILAECGQLLISEFRCKHLQDLRTQFLAHRWSRRKTAERAKDPQAKPWSRKQVNEHVRRVIRIFRWGVAQDMVPPEVLHRLEAFPPLLRGRTTAPDHADPEPVSWSDVQQTLPYLSKDAALLVRLIWLTGARSGEICRLRPSHIDRAQTEWRYRPAQHKTASREIRKDIWFGRQAQEILQFLLDRSQGADQPLFSTAGEPRSFRWLPSYTPDSLARAITKACRQAGVEPWSPKQLRAGRATEVEARLGLDHAAATLGDRLDTTRHHYSKARELARIVAKEMG